MCADFLRAHRTFSLIRDHYYFIFAIFFLALALSLSSLTPQGKRPPDAPSLVAPWLGHRGIAYYSLGVALFSQGVEAFKPRPRTGIHLQLQKSAPQFRQLAQGQLGFTEPFLYASQAFLFLYENPSQALMPVYSGLIDPHTDSRLALLGGFTELLFMGRPWNAGLLYGRIVSQEVSPPRWLAKFALALQLGVAPIQKDPILQQRVCRAMSQTFAQAHAFFLRSGGVCGGL